MPQLWNALEWTRIPLPVRPHANTDLHVATVGEGSPHTLITAGIHGDEGPWGALAIRAFLERHETTRLTGTVTAILAANPTAAAHDARTSPLDALDLNRVFPGDSEGSHSERLAHHLDAYARRCDLAIDLHGGGSWCVNAFAFRFGDDDLTDVSGAPFVVDGPDKPGNLIHRVRANGGRAVALEMGGRSRDEFAWRDRIADALERILHRSGVLDPIDPLPEPERPLPVDGLAVLRPDLGGIFVPELREDTIGTVVPRGTPLGRLYDPDTLSERHTFVAPYDDTALLLLRPHIGILEGGAMTYVVAHPR